MEGGMMSNASRSTADLHEKQVFTTGEAAELCNVSQQTIIRCFDSGRLNGFRVPGSRFRRIPRGELIRFMHLNEIPTNGLVIGARRVLIIAPEATGRALCEALTEQDRFDAATATSVWDAARLLERKHPAALVIDDAVAGIDPVAICTAVRNDAELLDIAIVVLSSDDDAQRRKWLSDAGVNAFLMQPATADDLLDQLAALTEK